MEIHPSCDELGYHDIVAAVEWYNQDRLTKYPKVHVHVTVETEGRVHSYEGTLKNFKRSTTNDGSQEINGWFATLDRDGVGHINVYADPDTGGPTALEVYDYDGKGGSEYKYPIETVTMEIDPDSPPKCPDCGGDMVLGHSYEDDNRAQDADGSRGRWVGDTLCPECFPGRVTEDGEKGLP